MGRWCRAIQALSGNNIKMDKTIAPNFLRLDNEESDGERVVLQ